MLNSEELITICKQFPILSTFKRYHRKYYDRARKLGVFQEATAHMIRGIKCPDDVELERNAQPIKHVFLLQDYWKIKGEWGTENEV